MIALRETQLKHLLTGMRELQTGAQRVAHIARISKLETKIMAERARRSIGQILRRDR